MKMSNLFGRTLRDSPAEADLTSHKLLLQAGMIHQVATGVYSYLPLAWRSLKKIENIVREEMDNAGEYFNHANNGRNQDGMKFTVQI